MKRVIAMCAAMAILAAALYASRIDEHEVPAE